VTRLRAAEVALRAEAKPVLMDDACAVPGAHLLCAVGAAGIDHELFRCERHAVEAAGDDRRLIACDDYQTEGQREGQGRDSGHAPSLR
jgi:hypothetical protein